MVTLQEKINTHLTSVSLQPTIGLQIEGLDLHEELSGNLVYEIRALLTKHKVIVFRDQNINRKQLVKFSKLLGEPEINSYGMKDYPEIAPVYSGRDNWSPYTNRWHSDLSGLERPTMYVILHGIEIPKAGGDTLFADMIAAYQGLADEVKFKIDNLIAVHDEVLGFPPAILMDATKREQLSHEYPPQEHPVVRTHPESGERILFVNSMYTSHIKDMDPVESKELLTLLCSQAAVPEYQLRLKWFENSVVVWDNRSTQHYASADYWPLTRRLERVAIAGDKPY